MVDRNILSQCSTLKIETSASSRTPGNSLSTHTHTHTHTSPHHKGLTAVKMSNLTSGSSAVQVKFAANQAERIDIARFEVLKAVPLKTQVLCDVTLRRWVRSSKRFERTVVSSISWSSRMAPYTLRTPAANKTGRFKRASSAASYINGNILRFYDSH